MISIQSASLFYFVLAFWEASFLQNLRNGKWQSCTKPRISSIFWPQYLILFVIVFAVWRNARYVYSNSILRLLWSWEQSGAKSREQRTELVLTKFNVRFIITRVSHYHFLERYVARIARRTITYLPSPFDKVINELRVVYISSLFFPEPKLPKWELFFTYFPSLHQRRFFCVHAPCPEIGMGKEKEVVGKSLKLTAQFLPGFLGG